jgi:hypothetical protein
MQFSEQDRFNLYRLATSPNKAYCGARAIVNLLERVHKLEQAQQQPEPAPSTPAGQEELVRCVAEGVACGCGGDWTPEAIAAILAVADWLASRGWNEAAWFLRREVGR